MGDGWCSRESETRSAVSDARLKRLRHEAATARLGREWLREIRAACAEVSRRFDPTIYGVSEPSWTGAEIDNLVRDVTTERLLGQGQLAYILDVAETIGGVHRLLCHQVRRALVARHHCTVIDRLLTRITTLLDGIEAYERVPATSPVRYRPVGSDWGVVGPSAEDLRRASARVRLLPISAASRDRAPAIFRSEVLDRVVADCFDACETSLSIDDFGRILREALTSWFPVVLELEEEIDVESPDTVDLLSELEQTVTLIIDDLKETHRSVLVTKLRGAPDSALAEQLSVSRPTAVSAKLDAFAELQSAWQRCASDLAPAHHATLAQVLYLRLKEQVGQ